MMPVRITDINYGMHMGLTAASGIFHNARVLFLKENGFSEMDIGGAGIMMLNAHYYFNNETRFNTILMINIAIKNISTSRFSFIYQAVNQENGLIMVEAEEEFAFFDYQKRKLVKSPGVFHMLYEHLQEEKSG